MNLYADFVENGTEFTNYEDLKNNFKIKIPENFNFSYDVIDKYEKLAPKKRALVWCDDTGAERTFTFEDIARESRRTANYLVSKGIKKGDAVMLILRRKYEFWFFITALHRIGAIAVPATNQLLQKDIEYRTNAAKIKMIVSYDDLIQSEIEKAMPKSPSVKYLVTVDSPKEGWISYNSEISSFGTDFPRPQGELATCNDDVMLLYFTSGTSGYPKMVVHNFVYPLGHIVTAKYWQNVIDDGLHLTVAETGWAKSVWGKLYGQWICGSAVFAYDMIQFKPGVLLKKVEQYKVTTFCAPPTVYNYLVRADIKKFDLSSLKHLTTAGEALNPEVFKKVYEALGLKMCEGYGQTESTVIAGPFPGVEPKPGSMGKPSPCYDVSIVRPDGTKCNPNEQGSIVISLDKSRPCGLFSGYFHDEEKTKSVFEDNKYLTGDTAYYDEDGYIWFVGRDDDVIKSSGYRVSPFEIESILQEHPAVLECAVTGVPDPRRGQAIKATIVLTKLYEASEQLRISILDWMKEKTAAYKHPRIIEFVNSLPKTISGKIRRVEIRQNDEEKGKKE